MKLKRSSIIELGQILKSEYGFELNSQDLERLAYSLTGYFKLLINLDSKASTKIIPSKGSEK